MQLRFKKKLPVHKVNTVQINKKLIILDGHNPLRYVDLETNKVHMYKAKTTSPFKIRIKIK